ncbi:MAG: DNA replication/repair protein RecF [Gammaproteobacteria bacterium]|nr:DNA replication/repair protein RecF [Gammaproteobacteria bacterium]
MTLGVFKASGFRCLESVSLDPDPHLNLIAGANASGKTSLLEAIYYLGRGRSFRASGNRELIRTGSSQFTLYGEISGGDRAHKAGIEVESGSRRVRVDGANATGADLAAILPVQAIDPEIHNLVQGGPEYRRRFLDWGVFHVKHSFLGEWRRFQQALRQRNAALRAGEPDSAVQVWDSELAEGGEAVNQLRESFFEAYIQLLSSIINEKLPFDAKCSYRRGWKADTSLYAALQESLARDRAMGSTQVGPHRADLALEVHDRRARYRVSRGQQKLLAATMVIAQVRLIAGEGSDDLVLLVDDPAAELDRDNRARLFALLQDVPAQMFVTALEAEDLPWADSGRMFHVNQGALKQT